MKKGQIIVIVAIIICALAAAFFLQGGLKNINGTSGETELAAAAASDAPEVSGLNQSDDDGHAGGESSPDALSTPEASVQPVTQALPETENETAAQSSSESSPEPEAEPETDATETPEPSTEPTPEPSADTSPDSSAESSAAPTQSAQPETLTCSMTINCSTILDNLDDLTKGKESLVPEDGWLLYLNEVEFTQGESVFDVLQRELQSRNMHLEFSISPLYDSIYVEGICNLYERDCGELSGWMYSVNGVFPGYGCSQFILTDGDAIAWVYTCDLGYDVGNGY